MRKIFLIQLTPNTSNLIDGRQNIVVLADGDREGDCSAPLDLGKKHINRLCWSETELRQNSFDTGLAPGVHAGTEDSGFRHGTNRAQMCLKSNPVNENRPKTPMT